MSTIYHALVLNLHQPSDNLEALLCEHEWEARQILFAFDRIARSLWPYPDVGRVHLSVSGTLLETLSNPDFQARTYGLVKCGDMLWHWQNRDLIRILGTGFYHPVLPLIPAGDWEDQLVRWQGLARHIFWRSEFPGFWPPEMGFCPEMIPLLKRLGYRYVIVDSDYVEPLTSMRWDEIRYQPHIAEYEGQEIIVVVRDRELSDAQEAGMDPGWFMYEVHERTKHCDYAPLITTASDGDNGGWFRNVNPKGNFWGVFYQPLLEHVIRGQTEVRPTFIEDYLDRHGARGLVSVKSGAWNTGWHDGHDFRQWTGSPAQRSALARVGEVSREYHLVRHRLETSGRSEAALWGQLENARWRLLRAQTSCHFYWGEAWLDRCHRDLDEACAQLSGLASQ
jgi:4-alpha-glucanotransferase